MIVNLRRDGFFHDIYDTGKSSFSAALAGSVKALTVNAGDLTVYDTFASLRVDRTAGVTCAAASWRGAGCFISQPGADMTPYRVKAYARTLIPTTNFAIIVGYAPATITGSDDALAENIVIPFDTSFDQLLMIPKLPEGDTYEDRALAFGILIGECTSQLVQAHLSVQKLSVSPPAFAQSVS